jgi:hypothetical protein
MKKLTLRRRRRSRIDEAALNVRTAFLFGRVLWWAYTGRALIRRRSRPPLAWITRT